MCACPPHRGLDAVVNRFAARLDFDDEHQEQLPAHGHVDRLVEGARMHRTLTGDTHRDSAGVSQPLVVGVADRKQ
ncbi:hypothetical protein A5657_16550 [Mycobacterium kubicae]|nr:hypothetical protein A5657_16550 [Mycobacterium kubicae]